MKKLFDKLRSDSQVDICSIGRFHCYIPATTQGLLRIKLEIELLHKLCDQHNSFELQIEVTLWLFTYKIAYSNKY